VDFCESDGSGGYSVDGLIVGSLYGVLFTGCVASGVEGGELAVPLGVDLLDAFVVVGLGLAHLALGRVHAGPGFGLRAGGPVVSALPLAASGEPGGSIAATCPLFTFGCARGEPLAEADLERVIERRVVAIDGDTEHNCS